MSSFADTNVVIYAQQPGRKGDIARQVLASGCRTSAQVLNEFASVAHRKLGKSWSEIAEAIDDVVSVMDEPVPLTLALNRSAQSLAAGYRLSFYDSLILAAALSAGSTVLFTEDLKAGQRFGPLVVVNPFTEA